MQPSRIHREPLQQPRDQKAGKSLTLVQEKIQKTLSVVIASFVPKVRRPEAAVASCSPLALIAPKTIPAGPLTSLVAALRMASTDDCAIVVNLQREKKRERGRSTISEIFRVWGKV